MGVEWSGSVECESGGESGRVGSECEWSVRVEGVWRECGGRESGRVGM